LRRYIVGGHVAVWAALNADRPLPPLVDDLMAAKVGRCSLTLSNPSYDRLDMSA
jgi:hypothetical protein